MNACQQLAKNFRDVFFGGNWTAVNLKSIISDINRDQAVQKVKDLNTIAELVFHIHYYINPVLKVLKGGRLEASDKYSFLLEPLPTEAAWQAKLQTIFEDVEKFAKHLETMDESQLYADFSEYQYGNTYRNILGIIEHTHYHLGQIVLIKKLIS